MAEKAWYEYPRIDAYGSPDPFGGFPKPDSNIQVPDGYAITALLPGTVTGINAPDGSMPAWGAVVTIKLDTPINSIATHTAYLHLASIAPGITKGAHVAAGDLVGYSGGSRAAGTQKVPVGFALYAGDYYGYGPEWSKYLGNAALNMTSLLDQAAAGKLNIPATPGTATPAAAGGMIDITNMIPGLSDIFGWLSSLQPLWEWLGNPLRVLKLIVGIMCIFASVFLLITPGNTIPQKAAFLFL